MRAFKLHSLVAWFVALNNSFKDHIIGSRLFRFHPEHLRTTYVGAEADDWPTLRFHTTRPHRRKQLKHNKHYITNQLCFYHTRQGQNTSVFIRKQCPARTALLQVETLLGHPQNIARVCGAPCPLATSTASIFAHHILQQAKAMRAPSMQTDL